MEFLAFGGAKGKEKDAPRGARPFLQWVKLPRCQAAGVASVKRKKPREDMQALLTFWDRQYMLV